MKDVIGFIGLGNMGWNMASHLAQAGHPVLAFDANPETHARFAAEVTGGAAPSLSDLAEARVILTMLPTGAVVREALSQGGDGSLINRLQPGSLLIDTTSSPPASTRALGALMKGRGIDMVDAGVSGGHRGAIEGNLVFMMGGETTALDRAEPILRTMGDKLFRMGPLGSGHLMKSVNNYVSAAGFLAACEAFAIGGEHGLDQATMLDVLNVSTGRNFATERSMPKIVDRSFTRSFSLGLFTKDIRIAAELADEAGVTAPLARLVYERMAKAMEQVGADVDHTAAWRVWEQEVSRPAHARSRATKEK